ncbi:MAG TPA: hypothetical protein VK208_19405 [Pyrinomonadaceae bacterium]|jgi:hypothetical protein|nr:hypothetical protein [Pyrinomonadaceae bacterium]
MTEEAREQLFGQYLTAKKAVAAYGLSEEFEEEQNIGVAANSLAAWATDTRIEHQSNTHIRTVSRDYLPFICATAGAGKTYIFVRYGTDLLKTSANLRATLVTSGAAATPMMAVQSGSMATQQPPTTDDQTVEEIIWRVGTTLTVKYTAKLTARLIELQRAVQEEEPDARGITSNSLQHFIEFLKAYPKLKYPTISITPERNIYASWKAGSDRLFSVHFLHDANIRFVVFRPNDRHPGKTVRLSGAATLDVLMNIVEPLGVLSWAAE